MVTLSIAGLIFAYILLAVLLLGLVVYSEWSWIVKATAIILVSVFYVVSYFSFPPLLGWATKSEGLPERFRLLAAHVSEPDKITGSTGAIYLWVSDMTAGANKDPRAFELDFDKDLHQRVVQAQAKLNKKLPQLGELLDGGKPEEIKDNTQGGQASVNIEFFDMPDPLFPEK